MIYLWNIITNGFSKLSKIFGIFLFFLGKYLGKINSISKKNMLITVITEIFEYNNIYENVSVFYTKNVPQILLLKVYNYDKFQEH
jgi:hypothetical protein